MGDRKERLVLLAANPLWLLFSVTRRVRQVEHLLGWNKRTREISTHHGLVGRWPLTLCRLSGNVISAPSLLHWSYSVALFQVIFTPLHLWCSIYWVFSFFGREVTEPCHITCEWLLKASNSAWKLAQHATENKYPKIQAVQFCLSCLLQSLWLTQGTQGWRECLLHLHTLS